MICKVLLYYYILPLPKIMIALFTLLSICRSFFFAPLLLHYFPQYSRPVGRLSRISLPPSLHPSTSLSRSLDLDLDLDPAPNSSRHTMVICRSASIMMVVLHLIIPLFMQIIFSFFFYYFFPLLSPFLIEAKPISYPFHRPFVILFQLLVSFSRFISVLDLA